MFDNSQEAYTEIVYKTDWQCKQVAGISNQYSGCQQLFNDSVKNKLTINGTIPIVNGECESIIGDKEYYNIRYFVYINGKVITHGSIDTAVVGSSVLKSNIGDIKVSLDIKTPDASYVPIVTYMMQPGDVLTLVLLGTYHQSGETNIVPNMFNIPNSSINYNI